MSGKMSPKFVVLCSLAVGAIYASGYSISSTKTTALASPSSLQTALNTNTGTNRNSATSDSAPNQGSQNSTEGQASNSTGAANHGAQNTTNRTQQSPATNNTSAGSATNSAGTSQQTSKNTTTSTQTTNTSTKTNTSHSTSDVNSSTTKSSTTQSSTSSNTSPKNSTAPAVNTTQKYLDGTYHGSASNRIGSVSVSVSVHSGKIASVQITACDTHYPESYINPVLPDYVVSHQTTQIPVVSGATLSSEDFYYAVVQALQQAQNPNYKG